MLQENRQVQVVDLVAGTSAAKRSATSAGGDLQRAFQEPMAGLQHGLHHRQPDHRGDPAARIAAPPTGPRARD
ncbi:MAG: hypothetical protein R2856_23010 [Caldilineaceae bacterium]